MARAQAIRSGAVVVVCQSDDPEAASPVCSAGSEWVSGWLMFEDRDRDGTFSANDKLLRIQPALSAVDSLTERNDNDKFLFTPMGRQKGNARGNFLVGESRIADTRRRVVCMGAGGMARVAGDGSTACS